MIHFLGVLLLEILLLLNVVLEVLLLGVLEPLHKFPVDGRGSIVGLGLTVLMDPPVVVGIEGLRKYFIGGKVQHLLHGLFAWAI